jgi:hypothetical protein
MGINDKLEFREIVQTFTEENFPSEIDEYIQFFQDWKKEYAHLYSRIEVEYGYDYAYDYGEEERYTKVRLVGIVIETDEAYNIRMEKNKKIIESRKLSAMKRKKTLEEKEKEQYLKLKQKYEK